MVLESDRHNSMADQGRGEVEEQQQQVRATEQTNGAKGQGMGTQTKTIGPQENSTGLQATTMSLRGDGLPENGMGLQSISSGLGSKEVTSREHGSVGLPSNGLCLQSHDTGLRADLQEAFRIIWHTPQERLLSITLKMSARVKEEQLVRAMALVALKRPKEALQQLQEMTDCCIATYLAGQVTTSLGQVDDPSMDSFQLPDPKATALRDLARVFQVLVQERLCDAPLRDQAYQLALLECVNQDVETGHTRGSNLNELTEEVKRVCGPEISCQALRLVSSTLRHDEDSIHSHPSSLQSSSDCSIPSHLEISAPPTQPAGAASAIQTHNPQHAGASTHTSDTRTGASAATTKAFDSLSLGPCTGIAAQPRGVVPPPVPSNAPVSSSTSDSLRAAASSMLGTHTPCPAQCTGGKEGTQQLVTSVSTGVESLRLPDPSPHEFSRSVSEPAMPSAASDDGDIPTFYSFVILHAPEDGEQAEEMRSTLEAATSGTGATFSQDFAIPGRPTLACLEDAIDNSAFTVLLLTRNFKSRMQEVLTDSALINSIDQRHKYNSVIPLLPSRNPLPQDSMPKVLRTIIPLREGGRTFSANARKAISPEKVGVLRRKWEQDQEAQRQEARRQRLRQENRRIEEAILRNQELERLRQESWELYHRQQSVQRSTPAPPPFAFPAPNHPSPPFYPPASVPSTHHPQHSPQMNSPYFNPSPQGQSMYLPANISIHNARCIMIGNDSTMTIGDPGAIQYNDDNDYE